MPSVPPRAPGDTISRPASEQQVAAAREAAALLAADPIAAAELARREEYKCRRYFAASGPLARGGYPKHLALFRAGASYQQRLFLAANRVGKTDAAAYEATSHLTGRYPSWWEGRRFEGPIEAWASGDTSGTTRDIIQVALLGPLSALATGEWSGMLPAHLVEDYSRKPGSVQDAVETVWVRHRERHHGAPCVSTLGLKSYDQKRQAFQGTAKHFVWLDEEPPEDIHGESLMRLMTTEGLLLVTMTPLQGLTSLIASWLQRAVLETLDEHGTSTLQPAYSAVYGASADAQQEGQDTAPVPALESPRYVVMAGWDDAPHLTEAAKRALSTQFQPAQLAARSKGIPALGAGAIYPIPEDQVREAPFEIPRHWRRFWALDAGGGAKPTAAVWGAIDPESLVVHLYSVYKRSAAEPAIHIEAIKARGAWIPGVGDCAALIVTQTDAEQLISVYRQAGLDIILPDKGVETGIQLTWELLSAGRLKVFSSCGPWFEEYRLYRRDEKGRIVKEHDHLLDATRYGVMSGRQRAKVQPVAPEPLGVAPEPYAAPHGWMA